MNQDKLKANKPSNRGLVTRKIFASSQVPPRSLVLPLILLSLFIFFFYWFYSGLTQQQENLNHSNLENQQKSRKAKNRHKTAQNQSDFDET